MHLSSLHQVVDIINCNPCLSHLIHPIVRLALISKADNSAKLSSYAWYVHYNTQNLRIGTCTNIELILNN